MVHYIYHDFYASSSLPWQVILSYIFLKFVICVQGLKCPVCSKFILPDDIECHLVMCLTKPRLSYNGELLIKIIFILLIYTINYTNVALYIFVILLIREELFLKQDSCD